MEAVLILLAFAGVCLLLVKLIDMWGESTMGEEGWADAQKAAREADEMKKEKEEKKKIQRLHVHLSDVRFKKSETNWHSQSCCFDSCHRVSFRQNRKAVRMR